MENKARLCADRAANLPRGGALGLLGLALVLLATAISGQAGAREGGDSESVGGGAVSAVPCPFSVPAAAQARCGRLAVPERRDHPGGRTIAIFYAITSDKDAPSQAEPLLVLNGGPGQAASDLIEPGWQQMAGLRRQRSVVFVDLRGTGLAEPALFCRNLSPVAFWHGGLTAADAEGCLGPFRRAGVDFAAYNSVESTEDLIALRRALGFARWNLLATSYGTVLAQELMRRDGAAVRSAILNSPTTSQVSWLDTSRMVAIREVYRRLFADCKAEPACNTAYPDLELVFLDLARRLTEAPLPVSLRDARSGATVEGQMSFAALLDILTVMVGTGTNADRVPSLLWHLHQIALGHETARPDWLAWLYMPYGQTMTLIAYGLNATVGCSESRAWVDAERLRRDAAVYQPYVMPQSIERDYDVFCPALKLPRGSAGLRQPVSSAVPTLLLTGDYDTLVPTGLAETVARNLSAAQVLRFAGYGHDVFAASACARSAAAAFVSNPGAGSEPACLHTPRPRQFVSRSQRQ